MATTSPARIGLHELSGLAAATIAKWYRLRDAIEMRRLRAANRAS